MHLSKSRSTFYYMRAAQLKEQHKCPREETGWLSTIHWPDLSPKSALLIEKSWREGSGVKSASCSSRGPEFCPQHPCPYPPVILLSLFLFRKRCVLTTLSAE